MAALIPNERCVVLASIIFFLENQNATHYVDDQCSHLQGDGASLGGTGWSIQTWNSEFRSRHHLLPDWEGPLRQLTHRGHVLEAKVEAEDLPGPGLVEDDAAERNVAVDHLDAVV